MTTQHHALSAPAERLLAELAGGPGGGRRRKLSPGRQARAIQELLAAGLLMASAPPHSGLVLTDAGRAHLARAAAARTTPEIDPFRAQHLALARRKFEPRQPAALVNAAESPVAWLAQRGRLAPAQLQAAERLRADFTRAQLLPHGSLSWTTPVVDAPRGPASMPLAEAVVAARQRVQRALAAVGREFSGLLLDVCCFLKPLAQVERERRWPPRSGKVVLGLALAALARHYGLSDQARGRGRAGTRVWMAAEAGIESESGVAPAAEADQN